MAFIGRERELAVLGEALQRASHTELTRVVITGALGLGMSRLIDELHARIADAPGVVFCRGRGYEPLQGVAYAPVREALGGPLAATPDAELGQLLGYAAHDIAALMPSVGERLSRLGIHPGPPALDAPDQRGARVRESIIAILRRLAERGQLILVLEDIEHADPGTLQLVRALLSLSRPLPLTLIVGYHPEELPRGHPAHAVVREIDETRHLDRLALAPLSRDELSSLIEALDGERPTLGFMAAVMEGSRGNALIAIQLARAHQRLAGMRLSDPLEEIIHARLEQLERPAVRLLRLLAAARRPVRATDIDGIRLADGRIPRGALGLALESELCTEIDGAGMISLHPLCAEAIDQSALPAVRHELHAALAEHLAGAPAEAAWHWSRAQRLDRAGAAHLDAARQTELLEPGRTALWHYSAALELEAGGANDVELLASAAGAADAAGAFRKAAGLAEQAVEMLAGGRIERLLTSRDRAADRHRAAQLSEQLGRHRRSSGDLVGARQAFEQAVELLARETRQTPEGDAVNAQVLAALAQDLMLEGRFADSAQLAEQARTVAAGAGEIALREFAHATDTLAVDLGYLGQIDRAIDLLDEALGAARRIGQLDEVMRCYANKTTLLDLDSRREQALAVVKEGIDEANRNGLGLTYGAFLRGNAADILFQLGRWREAEAECRVALEFPPAGVAWFSPILYLGLVLVESRADDEAARLVGRTLLQLETVPSGQWSALVLRSAVSLALWRGDVADACNVAEQGWPRVVESGDPIQMANSAATVLEACAAAAERGRVRRDWSAVAEAGRLADSVLPLAEERLRAPDLPPSVGARREADLHLAMARAHAARVRGRSDPATWSELAERWAKIPIPYQVAKARWWQAQAALPTRALRDEARRALTEAWQIADELPAAPLRAALHDLAARGRIRLLDAEPAAERPLVAIPIERARDLVAVGPGPAGEGTGTSSSGPIGDRFAGQPAGTAMTRFGLSPRENSVLLVLAQGRTNREIAERLFISERTVAVHVRRILSKFGVSGRVEAAGLAIRLGLVPDDPRLSTVGTRVRDE
ncbi:LuxR family transcriptional regulator [soil metagenome]